MDLRYGCGVPFCRLCEIEAIDIAQRLSSCTANSTSRSPFWGVSSQVATSTSTSVTASIQEAFTAIQARHLSLSQLESLGAQGQQLFLQNPLGVLPNLSFLWPQELQPLQKTLQQHQHIPQQQLQEFVFLQPRAATQLSPQAQFFLQNQVTEVIQPSSSDKTNVPFLPSYGVSCQIAAGTGTSAAASVQAALPEIQAENLSLSQVTKITQRNSSDTGNSTSRSPSYSVSSQVAATSAAAGVQASLTEIQAGHFSLSQQPVSHAEQQLQQLQKQQLELQQQQQQQQQQNHHNNSKTSNHHSHQNAFTQHYNSITHHHNQIPTTANPGSYPHHIKTAQPPISGPSYEVTANVNELVQFAETFKQRRNEMSFSQEDVSRAIRKQYGNKCSDSTISKFEALKLSFQKLCEIKSLLQKWLENAETFLTNPGSLTNQMITTEPIERHRNKRTCIHLCVTVHLETAFLQNPTPKSEEIGILAQNLAMEKEVVRIWFENRRQKEEEINPPRTAMGSSTITESATSNMFESNAATGNPTITESATSNMFASIAATGNPTITESAHSYMLASMATMVQQAVRNAPQQLQQLQKQRLQQQQQTQQPPQQNQNHHHHHSNISNQFSSQNAFNQHHKIITHHHNQIPTTPNSGSHYHNIETLQPQISEPSPEETIHREELEHFAKTFKERRKELGFSQLDVSLLMGELYGNEISQVQISRFEELKLSFETMCELKPPLQKWLEDAESSITNPESLTNPMATLEPIGRQNI